MSFGSAASPGWGTRCRWPARVTRERGLLHRPVAAHQPHRDRRLHRAELHAPVADHAAGQRHRGLVPRTAPCSCNVPSAATSVTFRQRELARGGGVAGRRSEPGGGAMILPVAVRTGGGRRAVRLPHRGDREHVARPCTKPVHRPELPARGHASSPRPSCPVTGSTVPARPKSRSSISPAVRPTSSGARTRLRAHQRRRQPGEPVVLPRFEVELAVAVLEREEVRLRAGQVARGVQRREPLVVELLPQRIPPVARRGRRGRSPRPCRAARGRSGARRGCRA